ncbi:MAG TPA: N-acetylmuramoyl-L-alanine amidase [Casimicrobiaceae bacterium]
MRWLLLPAAQLIVPAAGAAVAAPASRSISITSARIWPADEYTRVIFESKQPVEHQMTVLHAPERVVLDLARATESAALAALPAKVERSDPWIAGIRIGPRSDGFLRVVIELKGDVRPQVFSLPPVAEYGYRLVVDLYPAVPVDPLMAFLQREERRQAEANVAGNEASAQAPARAQAEAPQPSANGSRASSRTHARGEPARGGAPWRPITIAIDPGHGGEDPGAIGRRGTFEKNVVLAIARRLKPILEADPEVRVMLTRDADYFVPLAGRVEKARRVRADLFVSIHADAYRDTSARGSSVFALSEHGATSAAARWLAKNENAADLIGGVDLGDRDPLLARTLLDLSQTAQISDSLKVGRDVLEALAEHNALHSATVEQAGFAVLKAPDIPSILVETAFISNPYEESKLRDPGQQRRYAGSIADGIRDYFATRPPLARA